MAKDGTMARENSKECETADTWVTTPQDIPSFSTAFSDLIAVSVTLRSIT
jgi:hypothetical protein